MEDDTIKSDVVKHSPLGNAAIKVVRHTAEFVKPKIPSHKKLVLVAFRKSAIISGIWVFCSIAEHYHWFERTGKTVEFLIGSVVDHMVFPDVSSDVDIE